MKSIAISQPRYLPALNYLQRIALVDNFILLDNVQRQSRGIENRNKILIDSQCKWLTIPIASSSREQIQSTVVDGFCWIELHKKSLQYSYSKCPYYDKDLIDKYYEGLVSTNFVDIVETMLCNVCNIFGIDINFSRTSCLDLEEGLKGVDNLYIISKKVNAELYVSGSNGREYGVKEYFESRDLKIKVLFHDFDYPVYQQYNNTHKFQPWLSFFDPLFNLGLEKVRKIIFSKSILRER